MAKLVPGYNQGSVKGVETRLVSCNPKDVMTTVRTTSSLLNSRLGEPTSMEMDSVAGATIMTYKLSWTCGCRAEGTGIDYVCKPCAKHAGTFSLVG